MDSHRWLGRITAGTLLAAALVVLASGVGHWRTRVLVDQGATLISQERYAPAARALLRAVAFAPTDARAQYYLGLAYAGLGQRGAALSHAEEALRLAPEQPEYEVGLAGLLLDAGRVPEALGHLQQVVQAQPRSADVRLLLADALRRAGDRERMTREYRKAIQLGGGSAMGALAREQLRAALAAGN